MSTRLRIGFIPLVDAAALIVAVDKGFCAAEGLDVELVREISWANVRDKLNIGMFDAAHILAPIAIASSLGIGHVKVPIVSAFGLGINGNAITVSPDLYAAIKAAADGDLLDPLVTARALARVIAERKQKALEPLTFGMTFPFSTHNYDLRFWMAAGGVDPDEDVRLVVLPPPFMVDSLANKHLDGFCVGAPWNSVAIDLGIGHVLHFTSELLQRVAEKLLAVRAPWAAENPDVMMALVRAHARAADYIEDLGNRDEVAALLTAPGRIEVTPELILRTLDGRMRVAPDGTVRPSDRYLLVGRDGAARPDPVQAAWFYAQMVRWGQAPLSNDLLAAAKAVFRPDLYDAALGPTAPPPVSEPADGIGAFTGPAFDPDDIAGYLAACRRPG
ncbi:NitT/TauT family transport system ATP-binding protein [Rhodopseudomonas rhenobacensis]|uniref:NitT/TauT family transport system ATP-binding protein n=1 Tax=Rhodopseudomonas rhenobacensis TaxID=87461 RepID=A0A7W7Z6C4_9BRAD|nr:CmpA/NrtA family ABC transporter substrate-binding protein [Rhodopseudomonas rhenobacensis]MBB5048802.1 NitT/TauT family transport system ATP-binding protein [Rhodopseudomonas rhenobacensis]